jgi:hypothetical protein
MRKCVFVKTKIPDIEVSLTFNILRHKFIFVVKHLYSLKNVISYASGIYIIKFTLSVHISHYMNHH